MAGISAVNMIGYMNMLSNAFGGQKLTPETRNKLIALGVDTAGIVTEAEGRTKLQEAQMEETSPAKNNYQTHKTAEQDNSREQAIKLADKLNVSYTDNDTTDDIINKIAAKITELINNVGEDKNKKAEAQYYQNWLNEIKSLQLSQIELSTSMSVSANMNIAFHGLY